MRQPRTRAARDIRYGIMQGRALAASELSADLRARYIEMMWPVDSTIVFKAARRIRFAVEHTLYGRSDGGPSLKGFL